MSLISDSLENEMTFNNISDPSLYEGDIEIDETDNLGSFNGSLSDVTAWKNRTWNTKNGPFLEIPYTLPDDDLLTESDKAIIATALWEFRYRTCVKYEIIILMDGINIFNIKRKFSDLFHASIKQIMYILNFKKSQPTDVQREYPYGSGKWRIRQF